LGTLSGSIGAISISNWSRSYIRGLSDHSGLSVTISFTVWGTWEPG
jgi:hypothetical protein